MQLVSQENDSDRLPKIILDWKDLTDSFKLRNNLVHGINSCSYSFATPKVKSLLNASKSIRRFCAERNIDLDAKLKVKKQKKV